ncbi:hypothetical protein BJ322DRAFT_835577 [Thelephora terrestris]|uniref:Uncharacterized protein n=1 Tax=Thelephora terrestris TaxID=56493 RepID=A0A9P6L6J9_9AGAM|nr:hypothetical protein BJ322DRAFT_835577 [Thelephora terrestris]
MFEHSILGESATPPLRASFGRGDLIENIVWSCRKPDPNRSHRYWWDRENACRPERPLHDDRIRKRLGEKPAVYPLPTNSNLRWPISSNWLFEGHRCWHRKSRRLNPPTPLRPFSSLQGKFFTVLDNTESSIDTTGSRCAEDLRCGGGTEPNRQYWSLHHDQDQDDTWQRRAAGRDRQHPQTALLPSTRSHFIGRRCASERSA